MSVEIASGLARGELIARSGDRITRVFAAVVGETTWVFRDGVTYEIAAARGRERGTAVHAPGAVTAPMPATVISVNVVEGDRVAAGDVLVVLEAMKMELPLRSPGSGRIKSVRCRPGDLVQPDVSLIEIE